MKQSDCPCCQEVFDSGDRFCKRCGLRRGKPFSKRRWWLMALLITLLLTGIFAGVREAVITAKRYPLDLSNWLFWLILLVVELLLLLPTACLFVTYALLRLRKYGVMTTGTVVDNYTEVFKSEDSVSIMHMSTVTFTPEVVNPPNCYAKAEGWLSIGLSVQVIYDPYNPRDYARVGKAPSLILIIITIIFGLFLAVIAIFVMSLFLTAPLTSTPGKLPPP